MNKDVDWTRETFLQNMKNATDLFVQTVGDKKVLPVIGNHDYFPKNQLPGVNSDIYDNIFEMWKQWLPGEAGNTFKNGKHFKHFSS